MVQSLLHPIVAKRVYRHGPGGRLPAGAGELRVYHSRLLCRYRRAGHRDRAHVHVDAGTQGAWPPRAQRPAGLPVTGGGAAPACAAAGGVWTATELCAAPGYRFLCPGQPGDRYPEAEAAHRAPQSWLPAHLGVAGVIGGFFTVVEVAQILTLWPWL